VGVDYRQLTGTPGSWSTMPPPNLGPKKWVDGKFDLLKGSLRFLKTGLKSREEDIDLLLHEPSSFTT
jgi:hypothetical protein